jgi:hypothetical protein
VIHHLVTAGQAHGMRDYLDSWGGEVARRLRILPYEELPGRERFDRGTYILAGLEYLSPAMLAFVAELHRQLAQTSGFRFLNHPTRTLQRFQLLEELHRRGRNSFRAVRAGEDLSGLRYPVFLRAERSHDGAVSPLLRSARKVDEAIGRALVTGRRLRDLLVVEFCDTADAKGYYRKYGAFIVGDRIIPRSFEYGRSWMLTHEQSEFSPAMAWEEVEYVHANPHAKQLAEIREIAAVDFGRIDYSVLDGRVETWEINLAPRIGRGPGDVYVPKPAEIEPIRQQSLERFYADFQAAFEAVDLPADGPAVTVEVDPGIVRAARSGANGVPGATRTLVKMLEPARPVLEPVAARVLPLLGKLARRTSSARG